MAGDLIDQMESSPQPTLRIGMIQGAETVRFQILGPHRLIGANGEVRHVSQDAEYVVEKREITPAESNYWVRFAARRTGEAGPDPDQFSGFSIRKLTVGRQFELPRLHVDNREDWYLTGPFETEEAALAFRRSQDQPGEFTLLRVPEGKAYGEIALNGETLRLPIRVEPLKPAEPQVLLCDVLIGIEFHWQHYEDEHLRGILEIWPGNDGKLVAVNVVPVEPYLASLNSSEMTSDSPPELLKAQTVAGRSTIFATLGKHHFGDPFDLCADDHCQCYYGADRERETSWEAVRATWGEVLVHDGHVCDARYSKICGGIVEDYRYVWENRPVPYLVSTVDGDAAIDYPVNTEETARRFIDQSPDVYCNVDRHTLPPSLRERCDGLFRWRVEYTREELERLLAERTGIRVGTLLDLVPLERGHSGRIVHLRVVGTEGSVVLGKELEIRRALSPSHLYSSCFYVQKIGEEGKPPRAFVLVGAGWGHGVGLCQVGATVMASRGFRYQEILKHYYRGVDIVRAY